MQTKRLHDKQLNKTKKRKNKNTDNIIDINYIYKNYDDIFENENRLSCFLGNNDNIINFAIELFYYILNYWKTNMPNNWTRIIKHSLAEKIQQKNIIKIGFTETEIKQIFNFINQQDKLQFKNFLSSKFFKVTSTINYLVEPEYTIYHVNFNKSLQHIFILQVKKLLLIKHITWNSIIQIYNKLKNKNDRLMYNFFVFDLIYSADKIDTIYRNNLGNFNFFRDRLTNINHNKHNYKKINNCNKSILDKTNYNEYGIYNSTEKYKIQPNSPYAKIMKMNNQPYIGGPSGSTALMYITLFYFYNFPFTYKNKIMLLGLLIADYVPLWHTIPEILLSAYSEFKDSKIEKYTLDKNSVLYSIKLLKPFV